MQLSCMIACESLLPKLGSLNPAESPEEASVGSQDEEGILCVFAGSLKSVVMT